MSRPQPPAARAWLLRGLLALLTLTGLGIWQGGHCAGGASAHHPTSVTETAAATMAAAEAGTATAEHRDPSTLAGSTTTLDPCHLAPITVVHTTMTATLVLAGVQRAAPEAPSSRPPMPRCFSPGVALIRLGVSRT